MNTFLKWLTALALLSGPLVANAALVLTGWESPGDGLLLDDTTSGMEWLNLSVTQGQSLNSVESQLSTTYRGFSVATLGQINTLATDAGVVTGGGIQQGTNPALQNLMALWGTDQVYTTSNGGTEYISFPLTADTNASYPGYVASAVFEYGFNIPQGNGTTLTYWAASTYDNELFSPSIGDSSVSVALVMSPVPLPASAWLMLSGLGGLGFMVRASAKETRSVNRRSSS